MSTTAPINDPTPPSQHACPNCGYCPHCGRSNVKPWGTYPWPYYPPYPTYPWPRYTWTISGTNASSYTWTDTTGANPTI